MNNLKIFLTLIFVLGMATVASSQTDDKVKAATSKTESFKVWGNCDMCKERIETTVKAAGATAAAWDSKTKLLSVTFDPSKTNRDSLSKKIAAVGHDTEKFKAPDEVYAKLPGCCKYERNK
jgi:copper chaperone CopZ